MTVLATLLDTLLDPVADAALAFGAGALLRVTALLAGATALAWLARRAAPAARHALWSLTFVAVLVVPLLATALPVLPVALPWSPAPAATAPAPPAPPLATTPSVEAPTPPVSFDAVEQPASPPPVGTAIATSPASWPSPSVVAALVWLAGSALAAGALLLGLWRARRLSRAAAPADDPAWETALAAAARRLGVRRRVRLRASPAVTTPMTGGVLRPVVLLPDTARAWSAERRDLVLLHELVHVARADALRHLLARLVLALYWFHPLVWWAARQAALAREEACDAEVLAQGPRPSTYARHLLDLAEPAPPPLPVLALVERSHLEKRLMAILRPTSRRSRPALAVVLAVAATLWALTVAAVDPRLEDPTTTYAVAEPAADPGSAPAPAAAPAAVPTPARSSSPPAADCWYDDGRRGFRGSMTQRIDDDGRMERFGVTGDGEVVVQTHTGDLDLCFRAAGPPAIEEDPVSLAALDEGSWRVLAVRDARGTQRMTLTGGAAGTVARWTVDGVERPVDEPAERWRDAVLAVVAKRWQIAWLRGQESSLRGEISSVRGEEASLRGEIASIRGHVASLRGEIASTRGEESSLHGEVASIRGHAASLRGEIASLRGEEASMRGEIASLRGGIAGLESARRAARDAETRADVDAEIAELERAIEEVERRIAAFDVDAQVAEVERRLAAYDADARVARVEERRRGIDTDGRVAEIEAEIARYDADAQIRAVEDEIRALDVDGQVARIEREIEALDADRRVDALEDGLRPTERALADAVAAVRR